MKIVLFTGYYQEYLNYFYKKNPGLSNDCYEKQMEAIIEDCFVSWGAYARIFKKNNNNSGLIIPNCKPLQVAWAKENNVSFNERDWQFTIPLQQVKKIQPDIFYMGSMFDYFEDFVIEVKKYTRNVFAWINCRIPDGAKYQKLELIFTSLPSLIDRFSTEGLCVEYLNSSFDSAVLEKFSKSSSQDIDFSFVGSITGDHKNRIKVIKELIAKTSIQIFGRNTKSLDDRSISQKLFGKNIYKKMIHGEVYGMDMFNVLHRSKITFNKHIDMAGEFVGNARMYEATGVGTLLLTDGMDAPNKIFTEDEVVYYDDTDDAIEKFKFYLENNDMRTQIAKKGQQRTLSDFSSEVTAKRMEEYFKKYMK